MIANSARILRTLQQRVGLRFFGCRTELPKRMPFVNAFSRSVRRECLDHFLVLHEKQLHRLLKTYVMYYNQARPHQGIRQRIPGPPMLSAPPSNQPNQMVAIALVGWIASSLPKSSINLRKRILHRGQVKPIRRNSMVEPM